MSYRRRVEESPSSEDGRWRVFDDASSWVDRFGLLLVITSAAVVTLSLFDLGAAGDGLYSDLGEILVLFFVGATLLLSVRASGVSRRLRVVVDVAVLAGTLTTIVFMLLSELSGADAGRAGSEALSVVWVVLSALAPILVVRRLIHHQRATGKTLLGALSAYLLIALAFTFAFLYIESHQTRPFFGTEEPTTAFMYFSLVTLTTLGYGDLAAVEPLGRLLATLEAVIGQVYLVTFVAMIVGLIVAHRQHGVSPSEPETDGEAIT